MAAPANLPIIVTQGADFVLSFELQQGNPLLPVDLTGATLKMEVRAKVADFDPVVLLTADTTSGIVITDATGGKFTVTYPATQTALAGTIPKDDLGVWDLDVTVASGLRSTPVGGQVTFVRQVTT